MRLRITDKVVELTPEVVINTMSTSAFFDYIQYQQTSQYKNLSEKQKIEYQKLTYYTLACEVYNKFHFINDICNDDDASLDITGPNNDS